MIVIPTDEEYAKRVESSKNDIDKDNSETELNEMKGNNEEEREEEENLQRQSVTDWIDWQRERKSVSLEDQLWMVVILSFLLYFSSL